MNNPRDLRRACVSLQISADITKASKSVEVFQNNEKKHSRKKTYILFPKRVNIYLRASDFEVLDYNVQQQIRITGTPQTNSKIAPKEIFEFLFASMTQLVNLQKPRMLRITTTAQIETKRIPFLCIKFKITCSL